MPLITPNPNGDGLDEELNEGDIVLRDENGEEIHFQTLKWEEIVTKTPIIEEKKREKKQKITKNEKVDRFIDDIS